MLYTLLIGLYAFLSIPLFLKKKWENPRYALTLTELFGRGFSPSKKKGKRIWIHAVSVGEMKVASLLLPSIFATFPRAELTITTATKTGKERAEALFPQGAEIRILPLDFPWIARKILKLRRPEIVIILESDFWKNFLTEAKKRGAAVFLLNGKLSERSFSRLCKVPNFARALFESFDALIVQSEEYAGRFEHFVKKDRIHIAPNMKFDAPVQKKSLPLEGRQLVTFGSTHEKEEPLLIECTKKLLKQFPNLTIAIVPRHPERFDEVAKKLQAEGISFSRYSMKSFEERVLIIDVIGILSSVYAYSTLSVVCGSFEKPLQGHDIVEPIIAGSIPLFGMEMGSQKEMTEKVIHYNAGAQVSKDELFEQIVELLTDSHKKAALISGGKAALMHLRGGVKKSWEICIKTVEQK